MDEMLENWFIREILAHEQALTRYISRMWPNRDEVSDLRQETYARVLDSARRSLPVTPRAFLFTAARHLMTDRLRRNRIVFIGALGDLEAMNGLVDEICPEQRLTTHQELGRLAKAFEALPPKCREVVWLRKVEQLPQRVVAERLGVQEKAIEKQVARGMRLIANALTEGLDRTSEDRGGTVAVDESDYG